MCSDFNRKEVMKDGLTMAELRDRVSQYRKLEVVGNLEF